MIDLNTNVDSMLLSTRLKNLLKENGFLELRDLKDKYYDDFTDYKGFGPTLMLELKEYLLVKYKMRLKRRPKVKFNTGHKHTDCIKIVQHFCGENKNINWGAEILMARKLLDLYSLDVILSVTPKYKNMNSLRYYMTRSGASDINVKLPKRLVEKKESVEVQQPELFDEYTGPIDVDNKPKTLKEFFGIK